MIDALSFMDSYQALLLILVLLQLLTSTAKPSNYLCTSSCGDIHNISYPFRLKSDPKGCGLSKYELACEGNRTVAYFGVGRYYVLFIDYSIGQIRLVDDGIYKDNCSSLPHHLLTRGDTLFGEQYFDAFDRQYSNAFGSVVIVNCSKTVNSSFYIAINPSCIVGLYSSNTSSSWKLYALTNSKASDVRDFCTIHSGTWVSNYSANYKQINSSLYNYELIHNIMANGFVFDLPYCFVEFKYRYILTVQSCGFTTNGVFGLFDFGVYFRFQDCEWRLPDGGVPGSITIRMTVAFICLLAYFCGTKFAIGMPFFGIFLISIYRRRHLAMDKNIEEFLQAHNNFLPIRYSYSNIKKITASFKHKLGEGGYGSVYKGTLRSGDEVAIKILKQSKAQGQDFINEIATIGRIYHVNVVQLIGFCFEGSKQALVYDLMSNGSLDKQIFTEEGDKFLNYKKIYEISLGVARGIEYLHRGCDMQILHFDIKPHNILLDKNFTPKVSDFGLAKLCPANHSIVSLTAARGTLGYMAPELFYRNIGDVSFKADVYSFGMLLMEMAGRRKNISANVEHSSQIYFPLWAYDQVSEEKSVEIEIVAEERKVIKKMIIVALWCIQLNPDHRPSMSNVLEMLEGDIDELQMPPKPLIYPPDVPVNSDEAEMELETFSTSSSTPIIYTSFLLGYTNDV
ncbi:rust resistance kinase Lr10 [Eucalyptus grandis]|uniref:rust resistance kinase Lr10 n=1 Tax=Eucalyptus grandis TaxID=71139 RepID=UPI00192ECF1A|nr:rust resistance kinase Lr10 [Eucalyptus grandis]